MFSIFHFNSYKDYFNQWVNNQKNNGHGEYRRLALHLNVSTTLISQIFNGEKDLSLELACEVCDYLHLNETEGDYFLLLVELSKAGSAKYKNRILRQIKEKQDAAKKLENTLKKDHYNLDDTAKSIYYSSWIYPAIRILVDIENINSAEQISDRLKVPKNQIIKCIDFLLQNKLIIQKNNQLKIGPAHIFLDKNNPLSYKHLENWRSLANQKIPFSTDNDFFYSGTYALSEKVADEIRTQLPIFIEGVLKKVQPSKSETTRCLNIDFFDF